MYDPTVDIARARWSPFEEVTWLLPLQTHLTHWRRDLVAQEEQIFETAHTADVLFVADFPGKFFSSNCRVLKLDVAL